MGARWCRGAWTRRCVCGSCRSDSRCAASGCAVLRIEYQTTGHGIEAHGTAVCLFLTPENRLPQIVAQLAHFLPLCLNVGEDRVAGFLHARQLFQVVEIACTF